MPLVVPHKPNPPLYKDIKREEDLSLSLSPILFLSFRSMGPFILLLLLSLSFTLSSSLANPDPLLPRPLILEYPNSGGDEDIDVEEVRMRCASWRLAAEANNLGPWKTVPEDCGGYVRDYVSGKGYKYDLEMVLKEASAYARSVQLVGDGMDAWIFDVDETLLSNLPYYADHGYGLEVFNVHEFDKWVEKAIAPPVPYSLKLYREILSLGFKIIFLTGRSEDQRSATVDNLKKAGFQYWDTLILRGENDHGKPAIAYKSEKRSAMVTEGYRILGNSGDQWSDLVGHSISNRSFKFPNPMYYIP